jgi:hypothetical protein
LVGAVLHRSGGASRRVWRGLGWEVVMSFPNFHLTKGKVKGRVGDMTPQFTYDFKIFNGRVKVYVDGYVMFTFNQIDFKGYYAYKDDTSLYGIDIYLMNEKGGATTMEIYFKTRENWLGVLRLLDEKL